MVEFWLESIRSRARDVLAGFTNGPRPGAGLEPMREDPLWTDPPPPPAAEPAGITAASEAIPVAFDIRRPEQIVALQAGLGESIRAAKPIR